MLEHAGLLASDGRASAAVLSGLPRLLVVDDDNLHRMIICRAAAKAGYAPAGAASCGEAAVLVQKTVFDCITLDLSLGPDAGVEVLRQLRVIGCNAPIILISGCDDATRTETVMVAKALGLTIWESMAKPVDLVRLRGSLAHLKSGRETATVAA